MLKLIGVHDRGRHQLTEEELHMVLDESTQSGIIEQQEHKMVRNIFSWTTGRWLPSWFRAARWSISI